MSFLSPIVNALNPFQLFGQAGSSVDNVHVEDSNSSFGVDTQADGGNANAISDQTEVRLNEFDYTKASINHLLTLLNVESKQYSLEKMRVIREKVVAISTEFKAMKELMAEIETATSQNTSTITVQDYPELQKKIEAVKASGVSNQLLDKESLTMKEVDSLLKFLQHKTSSTQQDLTQQQTSMSHVVEHFNTVTQALLKILSDIRQTVRQIFSSRA